jgi:CRISPR system Cascade subunit CasD
MSDYLVFQLQGPMASWGEPAPGEVRHTHPLPSRSALLGLLAAALGIRRDEEQRLAEFNRHYQFLVCANEKSHWMRDYHTVQVPKESRKTRYFTRRDELRRDPLLLQTTLSRRDFYCDGYWLVVVSMTEGAPYPLTALQQALKQPLFPLCLGRKSHPLALPLWPHCFSGEIGAVLKQARNHYRQALQDLKVMEAFITDLQPCYWWEGDHPGLTVTTVSQRRDQPLSRRRWQFAERTVKKGHLPEETPCISQK